MNHITPFPCLLSAPALAIGISMLTLGCTHEYTVTPTYRSKLAELPERAVCARGETLQISIANPSPAPMDAGTVTGGIHTFKHQFDRDPALALKEGLAAALQGGQCKLSSPGDADLKVVLVNMWAHGEPCGFVSCDGTASTHVEITLSDASGKVLSQESISTDANDSCGMTFCGDEETSDLASQSMSQAIGKAVTAIGLALARRGGEARIAVR